MSSPSGSLDTDALLALVPRLRAAISASETCPRDGTGAPTIPRDDERFLLRFLACAKGDVAKATARHDAYWKARREFFGAEDRPLDEAKCLAIRASMPFLLAPGDAVDLHGRQVLVTRPPLIDWSRLATLDALEYVWFTYEEAFRRNPDAAPFVSVIHVRGITSRSMNRTFMRMMAKSLFGAMPTRFAAVFVCEPPAIFRFVVWPFVRLLLPKKISERVQILPKEACEEALAKLLPRSSVPVELGGTLELER